MNLSGRWVGIQVQTPMLLSTSPDNGAISHALEPPPFAFKKNEGFGADTLCPSAICSWAAQSPAGLQTQSSQWSSASKKDPSLQPAQPHFSHWRSFQYVGKGQEIVQPPSPDDLWCSWLVEGRVDRGLLMESTGLAVILVLPSPAMCPRVCYWNLLGLCFLLCRIFPSVLFLHHWRTSLNT